MNAFSAFDTQVAGSHYKRFVMQPTFYISKNRWDFAAGNILKYVLRHDLKDGVQGLDKASHYVEIRQEAFAYRKPFFALRVLNVSFVPPVQIPMSDFIHVNRIEDQDIRLFLILLERWVLTERPPESMPRDVADSIDVVKRRYLTQGA